MKKSVKKWNTQKKVEHNMWKSIPWKLQNIIEKK